MNFKMLASAAGTQNLNDAAMSACGQMLAAHFSGFSWTPVTQGAISSLAIAYDANWQGGSFSGDTRIGTSALLRQGGTLFTARYSEVRTSAWQTFAGPIAPGDWCTLVSCVGAKPDFSATGGLIEFGIATSNNCPGCSKTLSGGLDNFSVNLVAAPVPEPGTSALSALGLLALGLRVVGQGRARPHRADGRRLTGPAQSAAPSFAGGAVLVLALWAP